MSALEPPDDEQERRPRRVKLPRLSAVPSDPLDPRQLDMFSELSNLNGSGDKYRE
jgi:hypothetical protein